MAGPIYQALNPDSKEIRAIHILDDETQASTELRCKMVTISRSDPGASFDALSYSWGDPTATETIQVNGVDVTVRNNLANALRHFRCHGIGREIPIWIDALCINQGDIPERNSQVSTMRELYIQARTVYIWLGAYPAVKVEGMRALRSLRDHLRARKAYESWPIEGDAAAQDKVEALADLARNGYWSRTWIVQEDVSAFAIVVLGGGDQVEFERRERGEDGVSFGWQLSDISSAIRLRYGSIEEHPSAVQVQDRFKVFHMAYLSQYIVIPGSIQDPMFLHLYTQLLQRFRPMEATDPRDKIYGILGLVPTELAIPVDYADSVKNIYAQFTARMMDVNQNLEVVSTACSDNAALPSWVPDYQNLPRSPEDFVQRLRAARAGSAHGFQYVISSIGELLVKGVTLGKVTEVSAPIPNAAWSTLASEAWHDLVAQLRNSEFGMYRLACGAMLACSDIDRSLQHPQVDSLSFISGQQPLAQSRFATTIEQCLVRFHAFWTSSGFGGIVMKGAVEVGDEAILPVGALSPFCATASHDHGSLSYKLRAPCFMEHRINILPKDASREQMPLLMDGSLLGDYTTQGRVDLHKAFPLQDFIIA